MKLNNKNISQKSNEVFIIAEAGVNHSGDMNLAKRLIDEAILGGADAIKFQTYKAEKIASKYSPSYWDLSKQPITSQYELFKTLDSFNMTDYQELSDYCKLKGILFMSTPFDSESAAFLNNMMDIFKIASADLTNHPFLRQIARYNKPIILSTGASTIGEIEEAVRIIENEGNDQISLLHCILSYPTKYEDANLAMINSLKNIFPNYTIGYSDHTLPDDSMLALTSSVMLGARIIEKHFTFDKHLKGNDHFHSMDYLDLKRFIKNIEMYFKLLGDDVKRPVDAEKEAIKFARRSIVSLCDIKKGTVLTEKMFTTKRPGTGIQPKYFDAVIGRVALVDIKEDEILKWEMI